MYRLPRMNGRDGEKPQKDSFLAGCAWLLLGIIGAIWYWHHWTSEIKKKAEADVNRMIRSMERQRENIDRQQIEEEWKAKTQEDQRRMGELRKVVEEYQRSKKRP